MKVERKTLQFEGMRDIVLECLNGFSLMAPVDTGQFRANFIAGMHDTDLEPHPVEPFPAQPNQPVLRKEDYDKTMWIVNNAPYAGELERGHSGQAPQGVVRPTLNRLGLTGTFEGE